MVENARESLPIQDQIVASVQSRVGEIGLGNVYPRLDSSHLIFPTPVTVDDRTTQNFQDMGIPKGFRVVIVSPRSLEAANPTVRTSVRAVAEYLPTEPSEESQPDDFGFMYKPGPKPERYYAVNMVLGDLFGRHRRVTLAMTGSPAEISRQHTERRNGFVGMAEDSIGVGAHPQPGSTRSLYSSYHPQMQEKQPNPLQPEMDQVLLIVDDTKGHIQLSSLALPTEWRTGIRDGRLAEQTAPQVEAERVTPKMRQLSRLITTQHGNTAMFDIEQELSHFQEYRGVVTSREGLRTGSFGEEGTPVDVETRKDGFVFTYSGLDSRKLAELSKKGPVSLFSLADSFTQRTELSPDRIVFNVHNDSESGEVTVSGNIVRWNAVENTLESSLPYLGLDLQRQKQLQDLLNGGITFPYFLHNSRPRHEHESDYIDYSSRRRSHRSDYVLEDGWSEGGSYYPDSVLPNSYRHDDVYYDVSAPGSFSGSFDIPRRTGSSSSISYETKDSSADKARYWAEKAKTGNRAKVEGKKKAKKKK